MIQALAEISTESTIPLSYAVTGFSAVGGVGAIVGGFLWRQHLKNLGRLVKLEASHAIMLAAFTNSNNFISALIGMSLGVDMVPSSKIHELHRRFKPADESGAYNPIKDE